MKILVIDDCQFTCDLIAESFSSSGFAVEIANSAEEGMKLAIAAPPELMVVDINTQPYSGTELVRLIRSNTRLAEVPLIAVGEKITLDTKLEVFSAGANDVLEKPFNIEELHARTCAHIRRSTSQLFEVESEQGANVICFHSFRGGVGCSSAAANISFVLKELWNSKVLLVDANPWAGQIGLLLNFASRNNWSLLRDFSESDLDVELAKGLVASHPQGIDVMVAPFAVDMDASTLLSRLARCIELLSQDYDYIVVDLDSSLSTGTSALLEAATLLVHVLASTVPSVSASMLAFRGYRQLGISNEDIFVLGSLLNGQNGLSPSKIEKHLKCSVDVWIPWAVREFTKASNNGIPLVLSQPGHEATLAYQDLALHLSKPSHLQIPPSSPSEMWRQMKQRCSSMTSKSSTIADELDKSGKSVLKQMLEWF